MRARSLARRWALTPPFHPYPRGRSIFCATFRGSLRAAVNGHPALMEPGLSSLLAESDRLAHSGEQILSSRARQGAPCRLAAEVRPHRTQLRDLTVMLLGHVAVMGGGPRNEERRATRDPSLGSEQPKLERLWTSGFGSASHFRWFRRLVCLRNTEFVGSSGRSGFEDVSGLH